MTITPESLAASGSEDSHQKAILCWAALNFNLYPDLRWLHHSPNGGFRNKREAAKLKAMGVKPGYPDLTLLLPRLPFHGLLIELKVPALKLKKNGGAQPEQIQWGLYLQSNNYGYKLCHGWIDARDTLINYLEYGK